MRLICPHCQQSVTVPDSPAATTAPCPQCGQSITPPALTGAAIDAAPVPPPTPPPAPPASRVASAPGGLTGPTPVAHAPGSPTIGAPWLRLTLRREVAHWLAPGALLLAFLLTFFTWVAVAPNGTRVYTQTAWQAAGGGFWPDSAGESVMHKEAALKENSHWNGWLMFYVILLIPTTALAVADRVLARNPAAIPDAFRYVWPHRQMAVTGLCAALLLLLIVPLMFRVGLESAAAAAVAQVQPPLLRDVELATYGLDRTAWLGLAVAAQVVALIGAGLAIWLDRHPNAPDPRMEIYC